VQKRDFRGRNSRKELSFTGIEVCFSLKGSVQDRSGGKQSWMPVSDNRQIPFAFDLDGTLIRHRPLWEGLVSVLDRRPWLIFAAIAWAISGQKPC